MSFSPAKFKFAVDGSEETLSLEATHLWESFSDDPAATIFDALQAPGLPAMGDFLFNNVLGSNSAARVVRRRAYRPDPAKAFNHWQYRIRYESPQGGLGDFSSPNSQINPPWFRPVIRASNGVPRTVPFTLTRDNDPVVNTAGIPFDPQPTRIEYDMVVTFTRNEEFHSIITDYAYINKTNSVAIGPFDPGFIYCRNITTQERFEGPFQFFEKVYEFLISTKNQRILRIPNFGYMAKVSSTTTTSTTTVDPQPTTTTTSCPYGPSVPEIPDTGAHWIVDRRTCLPTGEPIALNEDGFVAADGTPHISELEDKGEIDFLQLGLNWG